MAVAICLFTADLRVRDNPVLCGALDAADEVVPAGAVTPEGRARFRRARAGRIDE